MKKKETINTNKSKTTMNKIKLAFLIMAVTILMTACEDQEKNKLDNRVIDYWKLKIDKNFKEAYKFLSPGWRLNESELAYVTRMNGAAVKWVDASIKSKTCSETYLCEIILTIKYEYKFQGAMSNTIEIETDIVESWLMKDNIWYNVPNEVKVEQK